MQEYVYFHKPSVPEYSFYALIQKSQPTENTTQFEEEGGICENEDFFFPPPDLILVSFSKACIYYPIYSKTTQK